MPVGCHAPSKEIAATRARADGAVKPYVSAASARQDLCCRTANTTAFSAGPTALRRVLKFVAPAASRPVDQRADTP